MSSYFRKTKNPVTGRYENAEWIDDYFAHRVYGVRFDDGTVYNPDFINLETKE